jgi:hypothetical protein
MSYSKFVLKYSRKKVFWSTRFLVSPRDAQINTVQVPRAVAGDTHTLGTQNSV